MDFVYQIQLNAIDIRSIANLTQNLLFIKQLILVRKIKATNSVLR